MGRKNSKAKKHGERSTTGKILKGVLDITRSGIGFVIIDKMDVDVLVRPSDFNTALHGDTVRVRIKRRRRKANAGRSD